MSASKDKILRKQQIEAGTDKRTLAAEKEAKAQRKSRIQYITVAIVLVIVFAFIFIYNSTYPEKHFIAVTIGDKDYTVAETNFHYSTTYNNFYNQNYYYMSSNMFFDSSRSLADQAFSEDMSWRDYFLQNTVTSMQQIQMLTDAANAEGYALTEEQQAEYDEAIESIETQWADYGYSSQQQFINLSYGKGVTMDIIREGLMDTFLASSYADHLTESFTYTDEELADYYAEHAAEYDNITYMNYGVYDGSVDADAVVAAIDGTDGDTFINYLAENYDGLQPTQNTNTASNINSAYSDWLADAARQPGDAVALTDETNQITYIVMYLDRDNNDYALTSFRHVLIMAEDTDGDGVYSEEELAAAEARAQELYDEWLAGDATEESFAELANTYSEDTGSNTVGGLYEDVYKGQMVDAVNDWLFEEGRKAGDTAIVTNDGSYTGAHILYFVGADDMTYAMSLADSAKRSADYQDWIDATAERYPITERHLGMCGKNH